MADTEYYYIDLNIVTKVMIRWGIADTANLTGDTQDKNVHRVFLTRGQYNKLIGKLK